MNAAIKIDVLSFALDRARAAGAEAAEGFTTAGQSLDVSVRMGTREHLERSEHTDLSLRVFVGDAQAAASTSDLSPAAIQALAERVVAMAKAAPKDHYCGLSDPALQAEGPALDLFDTAPADMDQLEAMARQAEEAALVTDGIDNSVGAGASWGSEQLHLLTSAGLSRTFATTHWSVWMTALAKDADGNMERDGDWSTTRHKGDLKSPAEIGREAARLALRRLGARKLKTQTCAVVFDRHIATRLINPFLGAISGAAVARGVSFLKDSLNTAVFGDHITLIDDPFILRGLGSAPSDREGVKRQKRALIDRGVLTTWLMHSAAARQLNLTPTGHATWDAGSPPGIGASNVYLEAGPETPEALMAQAGSGVLITDMFGPSLNSNTGDWSAGASGFWFEKGEIQYPVNEITVAGNLKDIYARLIAASDLVMDERVNSPSLFVDELTIAGQ